MTIHPSAVIEEGAQIGENVSIGMNAYISGQAVIGDGCVVGNGVQIQNRTTIGKNNTIFPYAVIGAVPQDLKYNGEDTQLIIGDGNTIREFCFFNIGTVTGIGKTVLGNNTLYMAYVHIAHDCIVGDRCIIANNATLAGHVEIGNNAVVGGMTPIHQFVKIGDYAMLGGASAVSQDIPPYCLAEGNRATLRGLNIVGLRRHLERTDIDALKSAYRDLFLQNLPLKDAAKTLIDETHNIHVKNIATFCLNTSRGIPYHQKTREQTDE